MLGTWLVLVAFACPAIAKTPPAKTRDAATNAALGSLITVENLIAYVREMSPAKTGLTPTAYPRSNMPNVNAALEH
jgi:hypothetical protein